jgi:hypothetical protein
MKIENKKIKNIFEIILIILSVIGIFGGIYVILNTLGIL